MILLNSIVSPKDIRPDSCKVLICPDWQVTAPDIGDELDSLYNFINKSHIPKVSNGGTLQKDSLFGGKWYLKGNGTSSEYYKSDFEPFVNENNVKIFIIYKPEYEFMTGIICANKFTLNIGKSPYRLSLRHVQYNNNIKTVRPPSLNQSSNFISSDNCIIDGEVVPDTQATNIYSEPTGVGFRLLNNNYNVSDGYTASSIAYMQIWEDATPFTNKEISLLMKFGKYEFGC